MNNKKRGQAAMEFLMTYGWAILAAIVVIGALAYFGVFSPSKYVPSSCVVNAPFGCDQYAVTASGVEIVLINGLGETAIVNGVTVSNCASNATSTNIANGEKALITVPCVLTEGDRFTGDITVTYTKSGGLLNQTATGSVSSEITA